MLYKRHNLKLSLLLFAVNSFCAFLSAQEGQVNLKQLPITIEDQNKEILKRIDDFIKKDMEIIKVRSLINNYQNKLQSNSIIVGVQRNNEPQIRIYYPLTDKNNITIFGENAYYYMPGISSGNITSMGLKLKPLNSWTIDVSGTILRYNDLLGYYHDFIINASSKIILYDNLNLHLYGGYSTNGRNNTVKDYIAKSPFAPNTHYGVGIGYKFSNSFKIEAGFKSEYNFWLKRWENQGYIGGKIIF